MKAFKRSIAMMLAILTLCGTLSVGASASVWRTGDFNQSKYGWTSPITVKSTFWGKIVGNTTRLYVYKCKRGTGHTGSCKNDWNYQGEPVSIKMRPINGTWRYLGLTNYACREMVRDIPGIGDYQLMFNVGTARSLQHWALEGVSNVSAIY